VLVRTHQFSYFCGFVSDKNTQRRALAAAGVKNTVLPVCGKKVGMRGRSSGLRFAALRLAAGVPSSAALRAATSPRARGEVAIA
jgi:hypothetical protein